MGLRKLRMKGVEPVSSHLSSLYEMFFSGNFDSRKCWDFIILLVNSNLKKFVGEKRGRSATQLARLTWIPSGTSGGDDGGCCVGGDSPTN